MGLMGGKERERAPEEKIVKGVMGLDREKEDMKSTPSWVGRIECLAKCAVQGLVVLKAKYYSPSPVPMS